MDINNTKNGKAVNGNTTGVKASIIKELQSLYEFQAHQDVFASTELLERMAALTGILSREVSVLIARDGKVVNVSLGDSSSVYSPEMRLVRNQDRLCGVRLIHTHPSGNAAPSQVDLGTLKSSMLDAMCSMGVVDGKPSKLFCAYLYMKPEQESNGPSITIYGPFDPASLPDKALIDQIYIADESFKSTTQSVDSSYENGDRAILVGFSESAQPSASLLELAGLAETDGVSVEAYFSQRRRAVDPATFIGSGKLTELARAVSEHNCNLVIFDDELSFTQLRNIERATNTKVIDRTVLILDIFAKRATSREGKLQVELAQLKYRLPRLSGESGDLSRLGGGIGSRGPGEKKLEIDRRRIKKRINDLEHEFQDIFKKQSVRRKAREQNETPVIALVGYTNAGKSTLMNALSGSDEFVSSRLFATLDTVVRKIKLPSGADALLSDTVGFIDKLPHELVQAFRSTLVEVEDADLLFHVVDASTPDFPARINVVNGVLDSLGASDIPRILVLNKADKRREAENTDDLRNPDADIKNEPQVHISALNGQGLGELLSLAEEVLSSSKAVKEYAVPYDRFDIAALIRKNGAVLSEVYEDDCIKITARLSEANRNRISAMLEKR